MSSSYSSTVARLQVNANSVEDEAPMPLSDLVRTAETSRLRRMGAISGAHRARRTQTRTQDQAQSQSQSTQASSRPSASLSAPNANGGQWSAAVGSTVSAYPWATSGATPYGSSLPAPGNDVDDDSGKADDGVGDGEGYAIYCGAESPEFGSDEPYKVSPLPQPLPFAPTPFASYSATPTNYGLDRRTPRNRTSTGCGALVHAHASPRARHGTWAARGSAGSAVVPMDKCYFSRGGQPKQFACGCRWHGVGCSKCGNALGHIYVPCQAVNSSSRSNNANQSSTNVSSQCHYTFYADAVSSDPGFDFPPAALARHHSHSVASNSSRGNGRTTVAGLSNPDFSGSYLPAGEYAYNYSSNSLSNSGGTIFSPGFYGYTEQGDAEGEAEQDIDSDPDYDQNSRREREGGFDANGVPVGIGNDNEGELEPGSPDKPPADTNGPNSIRSSGRSLMLWPAR